MQTARTTVLLVTGNAAEAGAEAEDANGHTHAVHGDVKTALTTGALVSRSVAGAAVAEEERLELPVIGIAAEELVEANGLQGALIQAANSRGDRQNACLIMRHLAQFLTRLGLLFSRPLLREILFGRVVPDAGSATCSRRQPAEK